MTSRTASRRIRTALCGSLVAVLAALVTPLAPVPQSAAATAADCPDVVFGGARGSGEPLDKKRNLGMGDVVYGAYTEYEKSLRGKKLEPRYVDYPALPVDVLTKARRKKYFEGLDTGVARTLKSLRELTERCGPDLHFVLAGYSQGAMVMHRVIWELKGTAFDLGRIDAVIAIGDGDRWPGKGETQYGSAKNGMGVSFRFPKLAGEKYKPRKDTLPSALGKRFRSVCLDYDIVCDTNPGHAALVGAVAWAGVKNHEKYREGKPGFRHVADAARAAAATSTAVVIKPPVPPDPGPVHIVTAALPDATVGEPYAFRMVTADNRPGRWRVASGALPAGLYLNVDNGQIAGTPTAAGTATVTIGFAGSHGRSDTKTLTVTVTEEAEVTDLAAAGLELSLPADARSTDQSARAELVDCAPASGGADYCAAVGNYITSQGNVAPFVTGVENGRTFAARLPDALGENWRVLSLDCPAPRWCVATGPAGTGTAVATIIDGVAAVEVVTVADLVGYLAEPGETLSLRGLACPSRGVCALAGSVMGGPRIPRAVVGSVDADGIHVRLAALPESAREGDASELRQLACATGGACVAVGSFGPGRLLVQRFSAGTWAVDPDHGVPWPETPYPPRGSMACPTSEFCYALGVVRDPHNHTRRSAVVRIEPGSVSTTLLELAHPQGRDSLVNQDVGSLACASATSCFAVGTETQISDQGSYPNVVSVLYRNNLGSWTGALLPDVEGSDPHEPQGLMDRVACPGGGQCVVSGTAQRGTYDDGRRLGVAHLVGGSAVRTVVAPTPEDSLGSVLYDVACPSRTGCLIVGGYHSAQRQSTIPYAVHLSLS